MNEVHPQAGEESALQSLAEDYRQAADEAVDLKARVESITRRALEDRRLRLADMAELARAFTSGVDLGLKARGGSVRTAMREAAAGFGEAARVAAGNLKLALQDTRTRAREFNEDELQGSLKRLLRHEQALLRAVADTAGKSGALLKEEWELLALHLSRTGDDAGGRLKESVQNLGNALRREAREVGVQVGAAGREAGARASEAAGGAFAAVSEKLHNKTKELRRPR